MMAIYYPKPGDRDPKPTPENHIGGVLHLATELDERLTEDERETLPIYARDVAVYSAVERIVAARVQRVERSGSFFAGGKRVTRDDYLALTRALECGDDGFQSPAAHPRDLIDPLVDALSLASDHRECPVMCELCGETLAATVCDRCHGSGCLPNAALAYLECGHCAGVGKVHVGCREQSYGDLAARAEAAEAKTAALIARVQALADEWDGYGHGPYCTHTEDQLPCSTCDFMARLRIALADTTTSAFNRMLAEEGGDRG